MHVINWKKNTALFLSGQALSLFGSTLVQYAIMWHITLATQSGMAMTLYIVVGILPTFFMSPFGGVWADRFNRKHLINLADGSIAFVTLLVALTFIAGYKELWLLFACAAMRALGQGMHSPAVSAFIPQITPPEQLSKINGINSSIQSFAMIVSPMTSGALLTFISLEIVFFIDVITAVIGIAIVYFLVKTPKPVPTGEIPEEPAPPSSTGINYFHDLREGIRYIVKHRFIGQLMLLSTIFYIIVSPVAFLTPLQVARDFGADVWRLTTIEIAFSAGMMIGGIVIGFWGGFKNKIYSMALSCALMGIGTITLGLLNHFWLYSAIMLFIGLTLPLYNTPSMVLFQTKVDPAYLGRVFGVFGMIASLMMPAGMLLFGPLGDLVSIDWLLISSGMAIVLLSIPFVASKAMREAGKPIGQTLGLIACLSVFSLCTACSGPPKQEKQIMVTIEPQRYFARQVADTLFEILTMVPPGTSPESYDPTPRQMAQLARCKAYFCIGHIGFENAWLDRLKQNNPQVVFFDNSRGIPLESGPTHAHTHAHSHAAVDPHTWTSPRAARTIARNICEALSELDPANRLVFQHNLQKLLAEIDRTDQAVQSCLSRSSQKAFIIYHPALTYFARDYGLTQYAIETEGKEPSPEQLKQLVDRAKRESIRTVFIQQEFDRKNAEIIARETGSRLVVINPLSGQWSEEMIRIAKALSDE
jgi:DHA3 family macrolide efflux protein-like MFS transporter